MNTTTIEEELKQQGWLCWTNIGTSMRPLMRAGRDLLVITRKKPERCRRYDVILFSRPDADGRASYILHRVLKVNDDGTYWVVGDNCSSGDVVGEEQILGILTAVIRDGKREIPVTSRWYRLYVHLWCDGYPLRFLLIRLREQMRRLLRPLYRTLFPRPDADLLCRPENQSGRHRDQ